MYSSDQSQFIKASILLGNFNNGIKYLAQNGVPYLK